MRKVTKEELYAALQQAAIWISGNNDNGCDDCPVDEKSCKQSPFQYCSVNIINDYIDIGQEIVEAKKLFIGK